MSKKTNIEWTDETWNVAVGCTKVDADCKYCYMYRDSLKSTRYNPKEIRKTKSVFNKPLQIKTPSKIFVSSLTDFFHEDIDSFRQEAWDIIRQCPQHTFQILTKRPERILRAGVLPPDWGDGYPNVWLGTSVGSMDGRHRIEQLAVVPSKLRFISFEPLHEPVQIFGLLSLIEENFHWAIIGGESGNETGAYRYRACDPGWIQYLVDSCKSLGLAVFVKQLGTYIAKNSGMSDRGDRHGRDIQLWPKSLQVREFPNPKHTYSSDQIKEIYDWVQIFQYRVREDALEAGWGLQNQHFKVITWLDMILNKAVTGHEVGQLFVQWAKDGGTSFLRDTVLHTLPFDNDHIPDFNAFVLLDEIGIIARREASDV